MEMTYEEAVMKRLVDQVTAQGLVPAQHYQTREIMLFAPTGDVYCHPDRTLVVRGFVTMRNVDVMAVAALTRAGSAVHVCRC